jgi:hypothetical protein
MSNGRTVSLKVLKIISNSNTVNGKILFPVELIIPITHPTEGRKRCHPSPKAGLGSRSLYLELM